MKHIRNLVRGILVGGFIITFPITRKFISYDYMFFTYAATSGDRNNYGPEWFRNLFPAIVPIGWISSGKMVGRGLALGTAVSIREFESPENASRLKEHLMEWQGKIGAKSIALGGRLPAVLTSAAAEPVMQFVCGQFGTVFILNFLLEHFIQEKDFSPDQTTIGILGVGFIGSALARFLSGNYRRVIAVDVRETDNDDWPENITYTTDPDRLGECDIVVILTAKGDDSESAINHMRPGVIVLDDAHPQLSSQLIARIRNKKNGEVYKAAVMAPGIRFNPRLPGFNPEWIPGCAIEAMVSARFGNGYTSQEEFNNLGIALGFQPLVVAHRSEK